VQSREGEHAYAVKVQHPDNGGAQQPAETLRVGPSRPSLVTRIPAKWGHLAVVFLAFLLGVAVCGGAVLWWQDRPTPPPIRVDEHAVEIVLFDAVPPQVHQGARISDVSPLHVDGALLLSGGVTSTVFEIGALNRSLDVRAPELPLTVSPTGRFQAVTLRVFVRDCRAATQWAPGDRPFTIEWRDEYGEAHVDRAGDFGRSVAVSLTRYVDSVCTKPFSR